MQAIGHDILALAARPLFAAGSLAIGDGE